MTVIWFFSKKMIYRICKDQRILVRNDHLGRWTWPCSLRCYILDMFVLFAIDLFVQSWTRLSRDFLTAKYRNFLFRKCLSSNLHITCVTSVTKHVGLLHDWHVIWGCTGKFQRKNRLFVFHTCHRVCKGYTWLEESHEIPWILRTILRDIFFCKNMAINSDKNLEIFVGKENPNGLRSYRYTTSENLNYQRRTCQKSRGKAFVYRFFQCIHFPPKGEMKQIILALGLTRESVTSIMMLSKTWKWWFVHG